MPNNPQVLPWQSLDNWFYSPQGVWAGDSLIEVLLPFIQEMRGETLLQMGACGTNPWLTKLSYIHRYIASPYDAGLPNQVITSFSRLPFDRMSIDCLVAPFTIELSCNMSAVLDEIDRVLAPMGVLILMGINPLSMWGVASKMGLMTGFSTGMLHLHSSFRVNRACIARGYIQKSLTNFGYIPPVQSQKCIKQFFFLDEIGKMLWPFPAGFYCYIAQKQISGYIPPKLVITDQDSLYMPSGY